MRYMIALLLILNCGTCEAMVDFELWKMKTEQARKSVKAIIGEAENQGYEGMYAVAHAIRNRGTLRGVYGLNSPRVKQRKYSTKTWDLASKAWLRSKDGKDPTRGADHWHNLRREGENYWTKVMEKTAEIGDHVFYRSK